MIISKSSIFGLWAVATLFFCTLTWLAVWMEFKITATPMPVLIRQKNCTIVEDENSLEYYQTKLRNGTCPTVPNGCFNRTAIQCLMLGTGNCKAREIWPPLWQKPCPIKPQCAIPRKTESIMRFRNAPLTSKTVFEWLNMYEPQSFERLEVISTLLQKVFDPVIKWSFQQSYSWPVGKSYTINNAIVCQDRLEYINCVMGEHLMLNNSNAFKVSIYPIKDAQKEEDSLVYMQKEMNFILNDGYGQQCICKLTDLIFKKIDKLKAMFSITTKSGKNCDICHKYKEDVYDKCLFNYNVYRYEGPCVLDVCK